MRRRPPRGPRAERAGPRPPLPASAGRPGSRRWRTPPLPRRGSSCGAPPRGPTRRGVLVGPRGKGCPAVGAETDGPVPPAASPGNVAPFPGSTRAGSRHCPPVTARRPVLLGSAASPMQYVPHGKARDPGVLRRRHHVSGRHALARRSARYCSSRRSWGRRRRLLPLRFIKVRYAVRCRPSPRRRATSPRPRGREARLLVAHLRVAAGDAQRELGGRGSRLAAQAPLPEIGVDPQRPRR